MGMAETIAALTFVSGLVPTAVSALGLYNQLNQVSTFREKAKFYRKFSRSHPVNVRPEDEDFVQELFEAGGYILSGLKRRIVALFASALVIFAGCAAIIARDGREALLGFPRLDMVDLLIFLFEMVFAAAFLTQKMLTEQEKLFLKNLRLIDAWYHELLVMPAIRTFNKQLEQINSATITAVRGAQDKDEERIRQFFQVNLAEKFQDILTKPMNRK